MRIITIMNGVALLMSGLSGTAASNATRSKTALTGASTLSSDTKEVTVTPSSLAKTSLTATPTPALDKDEPLRTDMTAAHKELTRVQQENPATNRKTETRTVKGCTNWDQVIQKFQELGIPLTGIVRLNLPPTIVRTLPEDAFQDLKKLRKVILFKESDETKFRDTFLKNHPNVEVVVEGSDQEPPRLPSTDPSVAAPQPSLNELPSKIQITTSDQRVLNNEITDLQQFGLWLTSEKVPLENITELTLYVNNPLELGILPIFSNLIRLTLIGDAPLTLNVEHLRKFPQLNEVDLSQSPHVNLEVLEFWHDKNPKDIKITPSFFEQKDPDIVWLSHMSNKEKKALKKELIPLLPSSTSNQGTQMHTRDILEALDFQQVFVSPFQECACLKTIILPTAMTVLPPKIFQNIPKLETVIFSPTLKEIGKQAFANCPSLTKIDLSNTALVRIGSEAFNECSSLSQVVFPQTVTRIGTWAFRKCTALQSPDLPPSVNHLGVGAFLGCHFSEIDWSKLTKLTQIPQNCFLLCPNLSSLILPPSLRSIGKSAFSRTAMKVLDFSQNTNLTHIEDDAFSECPNLTKVIFPASLQSLGGDTFAECPELKEIIFPEGSQLQTLRCTFEECESLTYVDLSNCTKLTEIGVGTFEKCKSLKEVKLPQSVKEIGSYAFQDCLCLTKINLQDCSQLTSIGSYAFCRTRYLCEVQFPASLTVIDQCSFAECTGLERVDLSSCKDVEIGVAAFAGTTSLTQVDFPKDGKVTLGDRAFKNSKVSGQPPANVTLGKDSWPSQG